LGGERERDVLGAGTAPITVTVFEYETPTIELQIGGLCRKRDPCRADPGHPVVMEEPPLLRQCQSSMGE
jgi:hypothetical protein